ncbi:hypothetical protein DFH06DRAFT_1158421 [Mycena polygramma]|nr:hypothetical protein DFH06DRAFT_1158421 [Mycena polygramma]
MYRCCSLLDGRWGRLHWSCERKPQHQSLKRTGNNSFHVQERLFRLRVEQAHRLEVRIGSDTNQDRSRADFLHPQIMENGQEAPGYTLDIVFVPWIAHCGRSAAGGKKEQAEAHTTLICSLGKSSSACSFANLFSAAAISSALNRVYFLGTKSRMNSRLWFSESEARMRRWRSGRIPIAAKVRRTSVGKSWRNSTVQRSGTVGSVPQ